MSGEVGAKYDNTFEFNSLALGGWILFNQYPLYPSPVLNLAFITYMEKVTAFFLANTPISTVTDQNAATLLGTLTPTIAYVGTSISQLGAALQAGTLTDVQIGNFGRACLASDPVAWNIYSALGGACQSDSCPDPGSYAPTISCFRDVCNVDIVNAFYALVNDMLQYDSNANSATPSDQDLLNLILNQFAADVATFMSLTVSDGYFVALQTYLNTPTGGVNATGTDIKTLCTTQESQPQTAQTPLGEAFEQLTIPVARKGLVNTFTQLLLDIRYEMFNIPLNIMTNSAGTDYTQENCGGGICCPNLEACCSSGPPIPGACLNVTGCTCKDHCVALCSNFKTCISNKEGQQSDKYNL